MEHDIGDGGLEADGIGDGKGFGTFCEDECCEVDFSRSEDAFDRIGLGEARLCDGVDEVDEQVEADEADDADEGMKEDKFALRGGRACGCLEGDLKSSLVFACAT